MKILTPLIAGAALATAAPWAGAQNRGDDTVLEMQKAFRKGDKQRLAALLPGARQARYWELFTELYASISREAEDDFQDLFGREFSRAYEEQIARLQRP